ncbi:MAG: 50S ribosomal protein L25/general stress protein Ctc [Bacteroidetes bacterium CG2_30_33_31]|nr:MAG: 50S ribosomal protein L25/general stress protein Ctc [Bacteroidetes bacterium CG2_30_33_31]
MKTVSMSGSLRENVGKKDAKALRKQGKVPCVLYGGDQQYHFGMDSTEFRYLIFTPEIAFVELNISGTKYKAVLQDIQYHVVTGNIMHADFLLLQENKEIIMGVPVKTKGVSVGVTKGGILIIKMHKVKIKAIPASMPEFIEIDATKLDIGDSVKIKDIEAKNNILLDSPNAVVVTVRVTRAVAAAAATTESAPAKKK